jgi:hypothetical protein
MVNTQQLHEAFQDLARVCDGAQTDDTQGFAAGDVTLGHYLAKVGPDAWEDAHLTVAAVLLRKYHRQVGTLELPPRPTDDDYRMARDDLRDIARIAIGTRVEILNDEYVEVAFPYDPELVAQVRRIKGSRYESSRRATLVPFHQLPAAIDFADANGLPVPAEVRARRDEAANATPAPVGTCTIRDGQIEVAFAYDPAMVAESRTIPGRRWNPSTKTNLFPIASAAAIVEFAARHNLTVADEIRDAAANTEAVPESERIHVTVNESRTTVRIEAPYSDALNDALYGYNGGRSTWHRASGTHRVPLRNDPAKLAALIAEHGLRASDATTEAIGAEQERQAVNLTQSVALTGDQIDIPGLGVTLRPHQHVAVRHAVTNRRTINGDLMGLGKTIESLAAIAADGAYPAIVTCKPDLTLNWLREVQTALPGVPVHVASGTKPTPIPDGTRIVIIGFAALAAKTKGKPGFPWVDALKTMEPRALIVDESQFGKEATANRSQALAEIGSDVASRDGLVMALTGTAIVNRVRELIQQLRIIGRLDDFGDEWAFKFRYCDAHHDGWGWTFDGATNTDELHHRLRAWGIYLRRGDEALNLPPLTIEPTTIPAAQLDRAAMRRYASAERYLIGHLADQARAVAARLGEDPRSAAVKAAMKAETAEHLVRINTLRQIVATAKLAAVTSEVAVLTEAGEKVMIAAHHRNVVDTIAKRFGGLRIQGGQTVASKEADKARFQTGTVADAPTITVAITAGGTGHTLTAAANGIQAELCWTPGELAQMAKRLHRIGQTRPVTYRVMIAEGTIDEHMWDMLQGKQQVLDSVLDGKQAEPDEDDERSAAAAIAWELAGRGLGGN